MYCKKCGTELEESINFCPKCGTPQQEAPEGNSTPNGQKSAQLANGKRPKCTHCGYVGDWKLGPVLRPIDFLIGLALMFLGFFPGVIYLGTVAIIRSNPDRREKICPQCKAQNLWTFLE